MKLCTRLLEELNDCIENERDFDCTIFPEDTRLEENEKVDWITQTFIEPHMINIYQVTDSKGSTNYISSDHGDGGIVVGAGGPWSTVTQAKNAYGEAPEGWLQSDTELSVNEGEGNMDYTYKMFSRLMLLKLRKGRENRNNNLDNTNKDKKKESSK